MASEFAQQPEILDIANTPDLLELARDVRRTKRPRLLRYADEDLAIIAPVKKIVKRSPFKKKSEADIAAFLSAAGSWRDVDTDKLKADIYESRHLSTRPRPEL